MIKAAKNSFKGGMSKDMSSLKQDNRGYTDALDIRVVTDHGGTGDAVINIQGNEFVDTIPNLPPIVLCTLNEPQFTSTNNYPVAVWNVQVGLTINNVSIGSSSISGNGEGIEARVEAIVELLTTDPAFAPYNLNVVASGSRIRIWSTTHEVTGYVDSGNFLLSSTQPAVLGIHQSIIGWTTSRDVFYIWTTNYATVAGGTGTLWAMSYDHTTLATTWDLVYSSEDLFMSTRHAIANPSGIEAAYENTDYLRLAFTDFYNPLRILNIFDETLMALHPSQFELKTGGILPKKPLFQNIEVGGALLAGMHQLAARYRTSSGSYSIISPVSNMVTVVEDVEDASFASYEGAQQGTATNKALIFEINGVDTSFDFIEIIHVFRDSKYGAPVINLVAELPANLADFTYTLTGNEDKVELTLEDYLDLDIPFTHCKTIAQKDNILFAGNVRKESFEIDFDARAYRYNQNNDTYIGAPHDINPDQDTFQYQQGGTVLGGTGVNVSYEIIRQRIDADNRNIGSNAYPHRIINPVGNQTVNIGGDNHQWGDEFGSFTSPWVQGLVKGYKRGEIYRFGFVPIRNGVDGAVNWIADIKMPWRGSADGVYTDDFEIIYEDGNGNYRCNSIGVEFSVDISSIQSEIDGFRIVRVERTEADKTMLGGGLLSPMIYRNFDDKPPGYYLSAGFPGGGIRPYDNWYYQTDPTPWVGVTRGFTWHCPDYLFGKPFEYRDGDQLIITGIYSSIDQTMNESLNQLYYNYPTIGPHFNVDRWKMYNMDGGFNFNTVNLADAGYCQRAAQTDIDGAPFVNLSVDSVGGPGHIGIGDFGGEAFSRGTDTIMIKTDGLGLGQPGTNANYEAYMRKCYADYYRPNAAQYGGNTESAKSNNVYIDTGALQRVDALSNSVQTMKVFGGDTYVTVFDSLKMYRNFDIDDSRDGDSFGVMIYAPAETDVNLDLRHGLRVNEESHSMDTVGASGHTPNDFEGKGEDFFYNYAYSAENNVKVYLPSPITGDLNEEYSERIYASLPKIKGEIVDSWKDFRTDTMIDLEGNHGPINALINNNDALYGLQDRAFGKASINERATVSTSEGNATALGTSGVLSRYDYISTHAGSRHQFGIVNSPTSIYFFDVINGELHRFSGGKLTPISSQGGMKAFFHDSTRGSWLYDNDSPIHYDQVNINQPGVVRGITGTYDYRFDEVLLTFHASDESGEYAPFTIGYDEEDNKFTSFYSFQPSVYLNDKFSVFSPAPTGIGTPGIYNHNTGERGVFYGTLPSRARVAITVQQPAEQSKIYTNMEWNSRVLDANGNDIPLETVTDVTVSTDYQTTAAETEFKRRFRTWRHKIGRDVTNGDRIRDHHATVLLTYQNDVDKKIILNDLTTIYDIITM